MAFDSRLFVAGVTLLVYFAAVATTAASGNSLLQFDLLTQQLMEPAAAAVSSISIAAMRSFVDDGGPVVPIIHHGRKMLSADTAKGPGKPHKVHADISAAISRAVSKGSMMGKKLTLPKSVAERMSVVGVRKEGRHTIIYTKKAYPREIIKIEAVGEKAAKVVAVSRIDERELAKSSGKGHQLSPEARRQCSAQNLTAASYLRSLDGLHLLYPDTWNEIDFVYHQNYGAAGQVRIPVLINAEIDNLMRETFHTLVSESQFAEKHNTTTCAIVDSARGIEGTDYASDIDAHSAVFRFGEPTRTNDTTALKDIGGKATFRTISMDNLVSLVAGSTGAEMKKQLLTLERNTTLLLYNNKATTDFAIKAWLTMYSRLKRGLRESGRRDVTVLLMSPLAYTGAKMLTLDVAKCLQAGGARIGCGTPAPTSKLTTIFAATHLCKQVTVYGDYSLARIKKARTCNNVQKMVIRTLAANKVIKVCGKHGCSN